MLRGLNLFESWISERLGLLEVWKLSEFQNAERPQFFVFQAGLPRLPKD